VSRLKLVGIIRESIVDGPGIRFVVFAQGCPHGCSGCHNPETWAFGGGFEMSCEQIIAEMKKNPLLKGLTLSGGEPFCQSQAMAELGGAAHGAGYSVMTYTGFLYEELLDKARQEPAVLSLLEQTDILIDGLFIQELKTYDMSFRGSSNQRAIDVKASLDGGAVVEADL
jgi:anaerobic ribonucleoside-triphosphate reductase activating protein